MASFKEAATVSRPINTHTATAPIRQHNQRNHSHSISLGAVNANHRVTRRKSMSSTAANAAAVIAASLKDSSEPNGLPMIGSHRRALSSRKGQESTSIGSGSAFGSYLSRSVNAASPDSTTSGRKHSPTVVDENQPGLEETKPISTKNRNRRASEGAPLMRGEGKRVSTEVRCDQCGKGYKHSSCLTKHMWEHDPAWAVTSKLLISKHQQVQLLEAASVLVNMNHDPLESPELDSDHSSASPAASSELRDDLSSAETTPPPMGDEAGDREKRSSVASSSLFSRSCQSGPPSSFNGSAPLYSPAFSHFRHSSIDTRPSTADTGTTDDEEADLAAAIGLCNFGTPRSRPSTMAADVPPVPPLPARYLSNQKEPGVIPTANHSGSATTIFNSLSLGPSSLSYRISDERDVKMEDADRESRQHRNDDVDFGHRHGHPDDDDDGVFGRMEE